MNIALVPSQAGADWFRLDIGNDTFLLGRADFEQLRAQIDQQLPRHAHNTRPSDPDAHVLFDSVCCGAQLYRCDVLDGGLPSKPLIVQPGKIGCANCGVMLEVEAF